MIIRSRLRTLTNQGIYRATRMVRSATDPDTVTVLYRLLGWFHVAMVISVSWFIVYSNLPWFRDEILTTSLALCAIYGIVDLVRIQFAWQSTISLGFLVVFFTLLINDPQDAPLAALLVAYFGSLISETWRGRSRSEPRKPLFAILSRAFFYSGHHAIAAFGAGIAYKFVIQSIPPWSSVVPIEAGVAYFIVYSLVSMSLVWPHDRQIDLCLISDQEQLVRVHWLLTALLLPIPTFLLYLYKVGLGSDTKGLVIIGAFLLFVLLVFLGRRFVTVVADYERMALHDKVGRSLGPCANMDDMVANMLQVVREEVNYRWGVVYGRISEKSDKLQHKQSRRRTSGTLPSIQERDVDADRDGAKWPRDIMPHLGALGTIIEEQLPPRFYAMGLADASELGLRLPPRTALLGFPITADVITNEAVADGVHLPGVEGREKQGEDRQTVGWVFLGRPKTPFTYRDWEKARSLGREAGNSFRNMLQVESIAQAIVEGLEEDIENSTKVQLWIQELISQRVDVDRVLEVVRERWLREHLRTVSQNMMEGKAKEKIPVPRKLVEEAYGQVRETTSAPVMPESTDQIVSRLQDITASLPVVFSLGYQSVDVASEPGIRMFFSLVLDALDSITIARIAALDSPTADTVAALSTQLVARDQQIAALRSQGAALDSQKVALKGQIAAIKSQTPMPNSQVLDLESRLMTLDSQLADLNSQLASASINRQAAEEAAKVARRLSEIIEPLQEYDTKRDTIARTACLDRALDVLEGHDDTARYALRDTERVIFTEIISVWRQAITTARDDHKRGPAELSVRLRSKRVFLLNEVIVGVELRNEGPGDASRVVVELEPSPDYEILRGTATAETLGAGKNLMSDFKLQAKRRGELRLLFRITYDDPENVERIKPFADRIILRRWPARFKEIDNPYTPGHVLKSGNPLFFGRDDVRRFVEQSLSTQRQRMICVLVGERRTGKTSLLHQLPIWLSSQSIVTVYIDGQELAIDPGLSGFFLSLAGAIAHEVGKAGLTVPYPTPAEIGDNPHYFFDRRFLPKVLDQLGDRTLLLAVDEFEELGERVKTGNLPPEVFPYLRHLAQHEERLSFIFAGKSEIEEMVGDYWSVLFNISRYYRFRFLDERSAQQLIVKPVAPYGMVYDDLALLEISSLTAGHPFFIQLMCDRMVERCNEDRRNYVTVEHVRNAMKELVDRGRDHFDFIWSLSNPDAKLTLAALADLQSPLSDVTDSAITSRLRSYQVNLTPGRVAIALEQLVGRDIIQLTSSTRKSYRFTAQLYAHWLRRCKPLSRVVEETSNELVKPK